MSSLFETPQTESQFVSTMSRRDFLRTLSELGGLVLIAGVPGVLNAADEAPKYGGDGMTNGVRDNPLAFVAIGEDGIVTIVAHRSEMGQGVRTSLPMVVADELDADWSRVRIAQAPGDELKFGNQDTDGSRSMRHWFAPMRRCGASARTMLEQAAAAKWGVPVSEVHAVNHEVIHGPTGRKLGYGALAKDAAKLPVPAADSVRLKDPAQFRYIGKSNIHLVDGADIATGKARYSLDVQLPGMLYAVIARPPVSGGKLASYDATAARQVPGVVRIVEVEGAPPPGEYEPLGGVAVIAKDTWSALKGREALKITWDDGPNANYDSKAYRAVLEQAARKPGKVIRSEGDVQAGLANAARRMEAEYYIPHLAHASMEAPSATARIVNGQCEIWAGAQSPQGARDRVAKRLGMPVEKVTVNVTLLGGGFGRKSQSDFVGEAALLSKAMDGKPVKVMWTREDDLQHDYYHTVSVERLEAGLDASGKPVAWLHRSAAPSFMSIFVAPDPKLLSAIELGLGLVSAPFAIPNLQIENPEAPAHTRIGWFRSVNNIPHAFAAQSFISELAAAAGRDHKEYLLEVIGPDRSIDPRKINDPWNHGESPERYPLNTGRLKRVIETVTKEANWGRKLPAGRGVGLAAHYSFVTYMATVIEVAVDDKGVLTIPRIDVAVDCGPQVNPDRIRSQIEGACIMGVSLATIGEITFKNGRVEQDNFHNYEVTRIDTAPRDIRVHLVATSDYSVPLGGVGEPAVPPIAPALCNAIFAATGKRIRQLPIREQLTKV